LARRCPSAQVLAALARALRLSGAGRQHLFILAGQPPWAAGHITASLTPGVRRLLDQLDAAFSVYDAAWNLIAWNPLWAAFEAYAVADLRSATARYPDDANLRRLVADLRAASSRFAALWDARGVGVHQADRKTRPAPGGRAGHPRLRCPHRPGRRPADRRLYGGAGK
jgi:hypothetical protein